MASVSSPERKKSHLDKVFRSHSSTPPTTPGSPALLKIPASPCLKKLGYGTGVNVYLYQRSPLSGGPARSPWAIKKLGKKREGESGGFISQRLEDEARILKKLKHPNIIGYRGFKRGADGSRILAVENGEKALLDVIESAREKSELSPFSAERILFVVRGVAEALHYLHTEQRLLHGDIKGGNILIKGDFEAVKLCDFGVTLALDADLKVADESQEYVGTGPWTAKEGLDEDGIVTDKTDIFALGCVIFEMLALEAPHISLLPLEGDDDDSDASFDDSEYFDALGTRPRLPEDVDLSDKSYQKVLSIFYACTEEDAKKRPSAKKILELLSS